MDMFLGAYLHFDDLVFIYLFFISRNALHLILFLFLYFLIHDALMLTSQGRK